MMRTPTPSLCADTKCSMLPSYTRTDVSPPRATYASSCSPGCARSTIRPLNPWRSWTELIGRPPLAVPAPVPAHGRARSGTGSPSCGGPADGEGLDPQGRLAGADGNALAVLAARAGRAHGEVVPEEVDVEQRLGTVADQVALANRFG